MQPFNEKTSSSLSPEILRALARVSSEQSLQGNALAQAVVSLSRLFTTERASLPPRYLDDAAHAAAYASYFLPVNLSKVQVLLDELPSDGERETPDRPMAVLDLGCGPGTGSVAILDWLWHRGPEHAKSLSVLATDGSLAPLQDTKRLCRYQYDPQQSACQ